MKLFQTDHRFPHPWSLATQANWRKYPNELRYSLLIRQIVGKICILFNTSKHPTCPQSSEQVVSVDILSRRIDPSTGLLHTERLICCNQPAPALLKRLLPIPEYTYFRELSTVDPKKKNYTATSWNLSMQNLITVEETCVFEPEPDHPDAQTLFTQTAKITAMGAFNYAAKLIEDNAVKAFQTNAGKGRKGLEMVIDRVVEEAKGVEDKFNEVTEGLKEGLEGIRQGLDDVLAGGNSREKAVGGGGGTSSSWGWGWTAPRRWFQRSSS
ncbi:hypothetical protein HK104_003268 [Borealophlyctis nickersoniae]|nr:hypothetical protein HK104_003268 [Borealophlyctis nickersoniae]